MTTSTAPTAKGSLCHQKHDDGTGHSLRYLVRGQPIGNCVQCGRDANNAHRKQQREKRRAIATKQARDDGKYEGRPCRKGHTERYVRDGACVECDCQRRRTKRDSQKDRARKREQNKQRATAGFTGSRKAERVVLYELESERRRLNQRVKQDGFGSDNR